MKEKQISFRHSIFMYEIIKAESLRLDVSMNTFIKLCVHDYINRVYSNNLFLLGNDTIELIRKYNNV